MKTHYLIDYDIDMALVKDHYMRRKDVSKKLKSYLKNNEKTKYVELAVGVADPLANYSANEHQLGPKILSNNSITSIYDLAKKLASKDIKTTHIPKIIYDANISYLKISIGSEMASLLQPTKIWVGNARTIWSHLVIKHKGDWQKATEELELYKTDDATSEMYYKIWRDIYLSMENSLEIINKISLQWAKDKSVKPGKQKHLWVDAVCSALYEAE